MLEFKCPSCGFQKSHLDAKFEGKKIKCPKCGVAAAVSAGSQPSRAEDPLGLGDVSDADPGPTYRQKNVASTLNAQQSHKIPTSQNSTSASVSPPSAELGKKQSKKSIIWIAN